MYHWCEARWSGLQWLQDHVVWPKKSAVCASLSYSLYPPPPLISTNMAKGFWCSFPSCHPTNSVIALKPEGKMTNIVVAEVPVLKKQYMTNTNSKQNSCSALDRSLLRPHTHGTNYRQTFASSPPYPPSNDTWRLTFLMSHFMTRVTRPMPTDRFRVLS